VTGARPFLVAWNIQLASRDLALARDIAHRVRERDGGLPAVQALGIPLETLGCVQVSMNLLDIERTPMWRVLERVTELATAAGASVIDTELIGLAPMRAFQEVADHAAIDPTLGPDDRVLAAARWLRLRDPRRDLALELRLEDLG
jgi:glutamate formiminotransferase